MQKTEKIKNSVKKNYMYNLFYQLVALMVPLVTTPYVSRVLGAQGVGAYSYTVSMAAYFVLFGSLGVNEYGQIQVAASRDKKEISEIFWELTLFKMILTSASMFLFWIFVARNSKYYQLYLVLGLYFLASMTDISWFLQGLEEFKKTVFRNCMIKILGVVLIILFVKSSGDVCKYAIILHLSAIVANLTLWGYMPQYLEKVPLKKIKIFSHFKQCMVFFIPVIATSVYSVLDKNMIGWITKSEAQNGYYEQAHKIQQTVLQAVLALSTVLLPRMALLFKQNKTEEIHTTLNKLLQFVACIAFPLSFGLIGVADKLVPWFLGKDFMESIPLLQVFSLLIVLIGYDNFVGHQCLIARGRQKDYNKGIIGGAIVNFIINCITIPKMGSLGAAIASVLAEMVIFIIFMYYGRDLLDMKKVAVFSVKYMSAAFIMFIITYFLGQILHGSAGMLIQVLAGALIYFTLCVVLKDGLIMEYLKKALFIMRIKR